MANRDTKNNAKDQKAIMKQKLVNQRNQQYEASLNRVRQEQQMASAMRQESATRQKRQRIDRATSAAYEKAFGKRKK